MGGVGIWCMHFIGNNSLTITLANGEVRALYYSPGFTFLSLIVAIVTMFLAFAFVGITEEAKIVRIVPSGVIAGVRKKKLNYYTVQANYICTLAWDCFHALLG